MGVSEDRDDILGKTIARAQRLLGESLISVVLFGSRARGTATSDSDFDLLIIARSLPDGKERRELALDMAEVGFDYGLPIQIILVTSEEAEQAAATGAPLMFEIYDAHRLLYDKSDFFGRLTVRFAEQLRTWRARKIKDRVWEVPGLAAAKL
jgi:hypothetical protein